MALKLLSGRSKRIGEIMARYCPFCKKRLTYVFMSMKVFGITRVVMWLCCGIPISRKVALRRPVGGHTWLR